MLDRYATLSGATGNIRFNQAIETSAFLPVSGGKRGRGKALSTPLATISLDALGVLSAIEITSFNDARASAAGAIRVHSVEPPCSIDEENYIRKFVTAPKWTS